MEVEVEAEGRGSLEWNAGERRILALIWEFYRTHPVIASREETFAPGWAQVAYCDRQGRLVYLISKHDGMYYADIEDGVEGHNLYTGSSITAMLATIAGYRADWDTCVEPKKATIWASTNGKAATPTRMTSRSSESDTA